MVKNISIKGLVSADRCTRRRRLRQRQQQHRQHRHRQRRRADRLCEARQHDRHQPDRRHAERARRRPDDPREAPRPSARGTSTSRRASRRATATCPTPRPRTTARKIVFSMRCPTSNTSTIDGVPACTGSWNIWEYDMTSGGLTAGSLRRVTDSASRRRRRPGLPAGRSRLRLLVEPPDQVDAQRGQRRVQLRRRRIRARARAQPAHDGRPGRRR